MKRFLLALLIAFWPFLAFTRVVTMAGKVTDQSGKPISFGTVYIDSTNQTASLNENGEYILHLEAGSYSVVFRCMGYAYRRANITLQKDSILNIALNEEQYVLARDDKNRSLANAIVRRAISKRQEHLKEIKTFTAYVYMKGIQKLINAPRVFLGENVARILKLSPDRHGILYLSEFESKLFYQEPDRYREVMLRNKVAGKNESFSFNKATDLIANCYKNILKFSNLTTRGFVSPLADYAFLYYRYKLLGVGVESRDSIYKIQVIPRRPQDPVFKGVIYIMGGSGRIYNTDLLLTKEAKINFVDTLNFRQQYMPVQNLWMPSTVQLGFKGKVLGFSFEGAFNGVYNNYVVNKPLPRGIFNGEILRISEDISKKDESYWVYKRRMPLTIEEARTYRIKDSTETPTAKKLQDSLLQQRNKPTLLKLAIAGYTFHRQENHGSITFAPLLPSLFYNTVEGFGFQYQATYRKTYAQKDVLEITPLMRYGLSNQHFNANIEARYFYSRVSKSFVSLKVGSETLEITNLRSSISWNNTFNTLFYGINSDKTFEQKLISGFGSYEASRGLLATIGLEYANRIPLFNTTSFKILNLKHNKFTSNNPFYPNQDIPLFPRHNALTFSVELDYSPDAQYITKPEGRIYQPSKYPRFALTYKKGVPSWLGSSINYDFASFEIYQNNLDLELFGNLSYTLKVGRFFSNKTTFFPDFYHYLGNVSLIFERSLRNFHYLDIYKYSTNKQFFEAHYEHNLGGFITNKVPLVRKLRLEETIGGAFLDEPGLRAYYEVFFGLQRSIFRVDYALAYDNSVRTFSGFRITYGF